MSCSMVTPTDRPLPQQSDPDIYVRLVGSVDCDRHMLCASWVALLAHLTYRQMWLVYCIYRLVTLSSFLNFFPGTWN